MVPRRLLPVLLLWVAGLAGCQRVQPSLAPPKPPEVLVGWPVVQEITDFEEFTGRTEPVESVEIRSRVSGYLQSVLFEEGAEIQKGDLLFEIDPRPFQAELNRAEANLAQAGARVQRLEADHDRAATLTKRGALSREEYDKISGDLAEARAAVQSARAARDIAQLNFDYCHVRAPLSGRISRRLLDPGNMVKADETALTYIANFDPMYAYFDVDERTYLRLYRFFQQKGIVRLAQLREVSVSLGLADEDGFPHTGQINFVDTRVDPNTGSVWVRGLFPNPKKLLTPGLFVRVRLPVGEPHQAVLIPEQALGTDQGQKFVYVVDAQNVARYRPVQVAMQHGQLRVVESGITPGERLVVSGLQRVRSGAPVEPREETAAAPNPTKAETGKGVASERWLELDPN
ncbi:MAG: efflux RND transporter periplasmic adaptor subunit, partial [Gemmataceae bacterium]|nr:efflux RND transporter periplasmic adaptor subunit [Gemmataceae bacterium]